MKKNERTGKRGKRIFWAGILFIAIFAIWTLMIQTIDVRPAGVNGTNIGFADFNCWFHSLTGVHTATYTITDWLGLVPIFICIVFGAIGLAQLVKRKSLFKVDRDLIILGIYYIIIILGYLIFEMIPINYRPILIEGNMEASYPSSTTLLVLSVMPTLIEQVNRRTKNTAFKRCVYVFTTLFSLYMLIGRLCSGVHWFTDILGSVFLSAGLFCVYKSAVMRWGGNER